MQDSSRGPTLLKKSTLFSAAAIGFLLFAASPIASAEPLHSRAVVAAAETGGARGLCRMGFFTERDSVTPPDDTPQNNPPAARVAFVKPCRGPVIGTFASETATTAPGSFLRIQMTATCVGGGGFASPCTVGQKFDAQPNGSPGDAINFDKNAEDGLQVHSMTMVWPFLPAGSYRFFVRPGGNGSALFEYRTFTVEAFAQ